MSSHPSDRRDPVQAGAGCEQTPPRQDAAAETTRTARPLDFAEAMRRVEAEVYNED